MPQVELHYTQGLTIDSLALFASLEQVINKIDGSAGLCKSRAYCISDYLHNHVLLRVLLIQKPHRDAQFMQHMHQSIVDTWQRFLPKHCAWSVALDFSTIYYLTGES